MRRHPRLDRLERAAGAGVCDPCGRALHGTMRFVLATAKPTPGDFISCPGCHRARVFTPNLGSAVGDDLLKPS